MQDSDKISDVMHRGVATCRPDAALDEAARLMRDHNCGAVPVVDEDERLIGIITDRDITLAALENDSALRDIPVQGAMSPHVIVVHERDDVQEAERQMSRHQVRRVPVVDDEGRVVGMVALADLALHADKRNVRNDLNRDAVGAVLTAISEPVEQHASHHPR